MANTKISNLTELTTPIGGDLFPVVDDPAGTPITKYTKGHRFVEMGELNYKIVVTISSNDLVVSLKDLSGSDPSAVNPLVVKIGNSWRTITAALSVTIADGTNTFNAGAAELAAKEIDYFVYLGWRAASSAVVIGLARIPWARVYSDFSGTATAETYGAFSTAPASTDDVTVIGRIAATLSAGAGYTWTSTSQSAPTSINTIQHPVYWTRLLTWLPTWTNVTVGNATQTANYRLTWKTVNVWVTFTWGSTTAYSGAISSTVPLAAAAFQTNIMPVGLAIFRDVGTAQYAGQTYLSSTSLIPATLNASATYTTQAAPTSTIPHTWTTSDILHETASYEM